jgi:aminopeptidase N
MKKIFLAILVISLSNCSSSAPQNDTSVSSELGGAGRPLTQAEAMARSKAVSQVSYKVWVDLTDREQFRGRTTAQFKLNKSAAPLFLDFQEGTVSKITVNGKAEPGSAFDGQIIRLPEANLNWGGDNTVEVEYAHPYDHTGNGIHQFKDPVDGRHYLYTQFESFSAHRFFPCFDQPDLKATYELSAEAPSDWQIISSMKERTLKKNGAKAHWEFPVSDRFSTYLFSLHAGPYAMWKSQAGKIPLRLFARQSLARYMDEKEWFNVTKQGLSFFGKTFGYPYPFHKYDQVIVPDFNAGAMENVAAVTFSERHIFRSKVTNNERLGRADTILHEMAHMWFGDLVTMVWWNDLWLNESFATFMSAWAVDRSTNFKGAWQELNNSSEWAIQEDQLVTTHPIEGIVPDTDATFTNFDGITYGKGGAVLKQIFYFVGEEKFKAGLRSYFQTHAYGNATLKDFMASLTAASGRDLSGWQKQWLQTAGVNMVTPRFLCENGKVKSFSLLQSPDAATKILRPHRTQVGFYAHEKAGFKLKAKLPVEYSAAETALPAAVGMACPDFVWANEGDYDYAKVALDSASLKVAKESLAAIADPFTRQSVYHTLWHMVQDGGLSAQELFKVIFEQARLETDSKVLREVLDLRAPLFHYLAESFYREYQQRTEEFLQDSLAKAKAGSDLQLIWFRAYVEEARSESGQARLIGLLKGKNLVRGISIDQDRRWEIVSSLARWGNAQGAALIAAELKRDPSDNGQKAAIGAESLLPDLANKKKWFARIARTEKGGREYKSAELRPAMHSLFLGREQEAQLGNFTDAYFDLVSKSKNADEEFIGRFTERMFPTQCDPELATRLKKFIARVESYPVYITHPLRVNLQETERCLHARELSSAVGAK